MLTMIHSNHAKLRDGMLIVDRKFHLGMRSYLEHIDTPIVSVHPESWGDESTMDMVEVPIDSLGYGVITMSQDPAAATAASDFETMTSQVQRSRLVYGGGLGSEGVAAARGIPQIAILEYDLPTQVSVSVSQVANPIRKAVRTLKTAMRYRKELDNWRRCAGLHCNGYPVFDAAQPYNSRRLLYLDSRMYRETIISEADLQQRLASRRPGRLKMLFSGRYEPIKGAVDCIKVALTCLARGIDVDLHCYGQGSLGEDMRRLSRSDDARGRITIHDAVTYPELVRIARDFDLFVCCHIQADPSCTYIESFGSGLPIVGYANTMWRRLAAESGAGFCSPLHRPQRVADDIERLAADSILLNSLSGKARTFALAHAFEAEFALRTGAINEALQAA